MKKNKEKQKTAGQLLAEKMSGKNVSDIDIQKATEDFFSSRGVSCKIHIK